MQRKPIIKRYRAPNSAVAAGSYLQDMRKFKDEIREKMECNKTFRLSSAALDVLEARYGKELNQFVNELMKQQAGP